MFGAHVCYTPRFTARLPSLGRPAKMRGARENHQNCEVDGANDCSRLSRRVAAVLGDQRSCSGAHVCFTPRFTARLPSLGRPAKMRGAREPPKLRGGRSLNVTICSWARGLCEFSVNSAARAIVCHLERTICGQEIRAKGAERASPAILEASLAPL
jgi:hypothetical protein